MGLSRRRCCSCLFVIILVVVVTFVAAITIRKNRHRSEDGPVPESPGDVKKYAIALGLAVQFFEVQKSGKLEDNEIPWRGDSALHDGKEEGMDLSKGMYDAGDHVKFGLPMAFTGTILSWAILEYGDQMEKVGEITHVQNSLKWITDYLINAHPSENVLYIQVGDPEIDHKCWERPETMTEKRPLTQINATFPGTEVAAETAAALASASLVFKKINSTYSNLLLKHAEQLFTFADTYRGSYSLSIPKVQKYYNSTGYGDELLWAASWLYHATNDHSYLKYVTGEKNGLDLANWLNLTTPWFSWDNKLEGTQILLSRLSFFGLERMSNLEGNGLDQHKQRADIFICSLLTDSPTVSNSKTDGGLIWISEWNSLQHPIGSAFLVVLYSDYMRTSRTATLNCDGQVFTPSDIRSFAISQLEYVLGDNPMKMSYLVGYGRNYPNYVHHRGASIPADATTDCKAGFKWLDSTEPNPNVAVGAVVGGPFQNDSYIDSRNNSMQGEPTTYNSAVLVGLLSSLIASSSSVPMSLS